VESEQGISPQNEETTGSTPAVSHVLAKRSYEAAPNSFFPFRQPLRNVDASVNFFSRFCVGDNR